MLHPQFHGAQRDSNFWHRSVPVYLHKNFQQISLWTFGKNGLNYFESWKKWSLWFFLFEVKNSRIPNAPNLFKRNTPKVSTKMDPQASFFSWRKDPVFQQGTDFHLREGWTITSKGTIRKRKALQDRDICTPKASRRETRRISPNRNVSKSHYFWLICDFFKFIEKCTLRNNRSLKNIAVSHQC